MAATRLFFPLEVDKPPTVAGMTGMENNVKVIGVGIVLEPDHASRQ